jgi:hypothetical protein
VIRDLGGERSVTMTEPARELRVRRFGQKAQERGAILISGCRSDQTSMDAVIDGDNHGALTYALWTAAKARPQITYTQAVTAARRFMKDHNLSQIPQLEGPEALLGGAMFSAPKATQRAAGGAPAKRPPSRGKAGARGKGR